MKKPNFFIVGAPKCGTTALSEYLRDHPEVFLSQPKEPSFFATDLPGLQFVNEESDYLNLFKNQTNQHRIIGEASPAYLFSETAIANIKKFNPDAYLIIMLRNPVDMLLSYHTQLLYSLFEDQEDFEQAWQLQTDRKQGRNIPSTCREPQLLQYQKMASFSDQIARALRHFPKEQIKIVLFDDFKKSPALIYQEVLEFLNLTADNRTEFPVINAAKKARFSWMNRLLHLLPSWALKAMQSHSGSRLNKLLIKLHQFINSLNSTASDKHQLSDRFKAELQSIFAQEIAHLSELLGRDLQQYWDN